MSMQEHKHQIQEDSAQYLYQLENELLAVTDMERTILNFFRIDPAEPIRANGATAAAVNAT